MGVMGSICRHDTGSLLRHNAGCEALRASCVAGRTTLPLTDSTPSGSIGLWQKFRVVCLRKRAITTRERHRMKIVVIGGSGLIGTKLVNRLRQNAHEVVAASPSSGVNAVTGEGLAGALAGARVVVD